jgi:hypothetical protein
MQKSSRITIRELLAKQGKVAKMRLLAGGLSPD